MGHNPQSAATIFAIGSIFAWGASDFVGGYATRRANAFLYTAATHLFGMVSMVSIAILTRAEFPTPTQVWWSLLAGATGGVSLALFYKALSSGNMGLIAPISAVLGAGIPTLFSIATEGFPGYGHVFGFLLAGTGVWLISRSEDGLGRPEGLWLAVLAGIGFASFYICIRQAGDGAAVWTATISRTASLFITSAIVLALGYFRNPLDRRSVGLAFCSGLLDVTGTAVFIRASQAGRLDEAVVVSSLYPAITVLLARLLLREHFTRWKLVGMLAALVAVPIIAG